MSVVELASAVERQPPLRPELALPLPRGASWHPATLPVMICHVQDWLDDTRQTDTADTLRVAAAASPHTGADTTTGGALAAAERRAQQT